MPGLSQDVQTHRIARLCQNSAYLSFKSLQAHKDLFIGHLHCDILHCHIYNVVQGCIDSAEEH